MKLSKIFEHFRKYCLPGQGAVRRDAGDGDQVLLGAQAGAGRLQSVLPRPVRLQPLQAPHRLLQGHLR